MLELSIIGVIILAAVYWAALWLMARHSDVLYGSFVTPLQSGGDRPDWPPELPRRPRPAPLTTSRQTTLAPAVTPRPQPTAAVVQSQPAETARQKTASRPSARRTQTLLGASPQPAAVVMTPPANAIIAALFNQAGPAASHSAPWPLALPPHTINPGALQRAVPATRTAPPSDLLASLLETIKQDLSEASRRS